MEFGSVLAIVGVDWIKGRLSVVVRFERILTELRVLVERNLFGNTETMLMFNFFDYLSFLLLYKTLE